MSIGASSTSSVGGFKARPMPNFAMVSPRNKVLLAEKNLTRALPFDFETEKRSHSRLLMRPKKPEMVYDTASDKENSMQMQQAIQRGSKRRQWSPRRADSIGLSER